MYLTILVLLDEQLAYFRHVQNKILSVPLKLYLSYSTLTRHKVKSGEQDLSKTPKSKKISPPLGDKDNDVEIYSCLLQIFIKYWSSSVCRIHKQHSAHMISLLITFYTGSQADPDMQILSLLPSNTLQLLHLSNFLYSISHPMESASDLQRKGMA